MKTILTFLIIFIFGASIFGQDDSYANNPKGISLEENKSSNEGNIYRHEFTVYTDDGEWKSIPDNVAGNHFLGKEIAKKSWLMESMYTYRTPVGPGNPGVKTVIQKPLIYNAIHRINKYYKKQVREGILSEMQAGEKYSHYLSISIAAFSQNTVDFEKELKEVGKKAEKIIPVFNSVKLISM